MAEAMINQSVQFIFRMWTNMILFSKKNAFLPAQEMKLDI
jgi:hypothetical protein